MRLRRLLSILFIGLLSFLIYSKAYSVPYEASTLHNAVSRSETIQDLFFERWELIDDMNLYFDWYGKINWVDNFKIYSIDRATGVRKAVAMRLVRTYGSIIINFPILGSFKEKNKGGYSQNEDERSGLWKPENLILGLTAAGFHYGLTREATVDRGDAGQETITDYKYTQFFDDIFAASLLYKPYFFIHIGIIINNQIEPNDDGTMDYGDSANHSKRFFLASNLLSFLNINATTAKDKLESTAVGLILNNLFNLVISEIPTVVPVFTTTFKSLNLFNDEPYDSVWVKSNVINGVTKDSYLNDNLKEHAKFYTITFQINENLYNYLLIDFFVEIQKTSNKLIEKRTNEEVKYPLLREINGIVGYNFFGPRMKEGYFLITSIGFSRYWDVSIPIHRESGEKDYVYGGIFIIKTRFPMKKIPIGLEFKVTKNYAPELRKLIETVDKYAVEASISISI